MSVIKRSYHHEDDYEAVGEFLHSTSNLGTSHRNWVQPRWEYAHYHPYLDDKNMDRWAVWEEAGRIVGIAHYEHRMGTAHFQLAPEHGELKRAMLEHAMAQLAAKSDNGSSVQVYIGERDTEFAGIASACGFTKLGIEESEPTRIFRIPEPFPEIRVPEGYRVIGLDEDDDSRKVHRVMHRGFNHPGEPPEEDLPSRAHKLSAPNLRKDLNVVAVEPGGQFVAYCGMWYIDRHKTAYVEPVATDPDHRRKGLGTAVVMEGIRRCARLGATAAFVGSDQLFYQSMGFEPFDRQVAWRRIIEPV